MKEIVKEETRTIIDKVTIYVANDGTEFKTRRECEKYEEKIYDNKRYSKIEPLRVYDLDEMIPIHCNDSFTEYNHYEWYKVDSVDDIKRIENYYHIDVEWPKNYPCYICIESENDERKGAAYDFNLEQAFTITKSFFKKFGYDVEFKRV